MVVSRMRNSLMIWELFVSKRKYNDSVCRYDDVGGRCKTVRGLQCRLYRTTVSGDDRINPVVVDIAVEDLPPAPRSGKPDGIAVPGLLPQRPDDDDVAAFPFDPAMEC